MTDFLIIPGSTRNGSMNKELAHWIAEITNQKGTKSHVVEDSLLEMPLYNGDLEESKGVPEQAKKLEEFISNTKTLVFCTPEYNGFFPPLTKNMLEWISRVGLGCFLGKRAILTSASPGGLGGIRGLPQLRLLLANLGCDVQGKQLGISNAGPLISERNAKIEEKLTSLLFS